MEKNQKSDTFFHTRANRFVFCCPVFFRDATVRLLFLFSCFVQIILWGLLLWFFGVDENVAVLRYNAYFGIGLTGVSKQIFFLPFVSFVFFLTNTILATVFFRRGDRFFALLLFVSSFFVQVGSAISVLALILVN